MNKVDMKKPRYIFGLFFSVCTTYYETDLSGAVGLVMGSEGFGISRLVKEKCDFVVSIPLYGNVNSMNVSCAAAVLMTDIARQRKRK